VLVVCTQVNILFDVVPQPVIVLGIGSRCRYRAPLPLLLARFSSPAGLADDQDPPELADASSKSLKVSLSLGLGHTANRTDATTDNPDPPDSGWEAKDGDNDGVPEDEQRVYGGAEAYGDCFLKKSLFRCGSSNSVIVSVLFIAVFGLGFVSALIHLHSLLWHARLHPPS
jgi:hypothetical protein